MNPALNPTTQRQRLTTREIEIAQLVTLGYENKQIAGELGTSEQTVKNQVAAIFMKLGVDNRVRLARFMLGAKDSTEEATQ